MLVSQQTRIFLPLLSKEREALEQIDIPLFTASSGSDDLTIVPNQTIDKCFTEPSFNRVVSRLNQLNDQDLEQQINFVRGALYSRTAHDIYLFPIAENASLDLNSMATLNEQEIVQEASKLAAELKKRAICLSDSAAAWIAPQYIFEFQRFQLAVIGDELYDGSCGIALFLAALQKVISNSDVRALVMNILQPFHQDLQEFLSDNELTTNKIGIDNIAGCVSIIYAWVRMSQFLEEPILLEEARKLASLITPDFISADNNFDIISGTAGAILGLLALYHVSADSKVLDQAINCGHHLLNHRVATNVGPHAWATQDHNLLTGFSHGAAGIAYALLRLYQVTGETSFLEAAQEAIAYERSVFIPEEGNWPDFRQSASKKHPTCMCSWCHGAPGIGLARLATLDILDTPEIRQDIEVAINTTKRHGLSEIDHVCCGNMGRIEFLFTAGRKLSRPDLVEEAMKQAAQVVARAQQRGHFGYGSILDFHPGFFQGASGIGYELLRLAYPDQLPSVLLWE
jgi:type 2 lantibiotic biosynthesis protein LanM